MRESFTRSLWYATAPPAPELDPLEGDVRADVCVIGAGLLGLTAALHLAEAGATVAVVEAAEPGFGASGRNGGFVVPQFARLSPEGARRRAGESGTQLALALHAGADEIYARVARHTIDCGAVRNGWLSPAHGPRSLAWLEHCARAWQALGRDVRMLGSTETFRLTGARFRGALFDPAGGHINPLAYVRGLARAAREAGASVFVWSPVRTLARDGSGWIAQCERGKVRAGRVLFCTNGAAPGLAPATARASIPLDVVQAASAPLPAKLLPLVLPGDVALTDTRFRLFSARRTQDGRLVSGAMPLIDWGAFDRLKRKIGERLVAHFPALDALRMDHAWHGTVRLTPDLLPRLWQAAPGVLAPLACNGRGLCMTTALGMALARNFTSGEALPLPATAPRPIALHPLARMAPRALLPLGILRDRQDERAK